MSKRTTTTASKEQPEADVMETSVPDVPVEYSPITEMFNKIRRKHESHK